MRTAWTAILGLGVGLAACGGGGDELDADYVVWGSSASTVTVAWIPIEGATAYTIERGTSEADLVPVATLAPPETSYLDAALSPLTAYTYRFSYTAADGTVVIEPVERTRTTAEAIMITDEPPALDVPVVRTVGAAGASIAVDVMAATVVVPPGAAADGTQLTIQPVGSPFLDAPDVVGLEVTTSAALARPVDLVFAIDELDAETPDNLAIVLQADDGSWIAQPRTVDLDARTITFALTPDSDAVPAVFAGPARRHAALVLRETFLKPRAATVKVNEFLGLVPFGHFTDETGCDDPETEALCLSLQWAARSLSGARQPVVETHPLANAAAGYNRDWLVDGQINGNAAIGTITADADIGALYHAPAAAPGNNRVVRATFRSVLGRTGRLAHAVAAAITIKDPGSIRITARMRADNQSGYIACPFANVAVSDTVTFSITMNQYLLYDISAIDNHPTTIDSFTPMVPYVAAGWEIGAGTTTEDFEMTDGLGADDYSGEFITVSIRGNSYPGQCWGTDMDGNTAHSTGWADTDVHEFHVYPDLHVATDDQWWSATAEYIETP